MLDDGNKKARGILRAASVRCSKEVIYPLKGGRETGIVEEEYGSGSKQAKSRPCLPLRQEWRRLQVNAQTGYSSCNTIGEMLVQYDMKVSVLSETILRYECLTVHAAQCLSFHAFIRKKELNCERDAGIAT